MAGLAFRPLSLHEVISGGYRYRYRYRYGGKLLILLKINFRGHSKFPGGIGIGIGIVISKRYRGDNRCTMGAYIVYNPESVFMDYIMAL